MRLAQALPELFQRPILNELVFVSDDPYDLTIILDAHQHTVAMLLASVFEHRRIAINCLHMSEPAVLDDPAALVARNLVVRLRW